MPFGRKTTTSLTIRGYTRYSGLQNDYRLTTAALHEPLVYTSLYRCVQLLSQRGIDRCEAMTSSERLIVNDDVTGVGVSLVFDRNSLPPPHPQKIKSSIKFGGIKRHRLSLADIEIASRLADVISLRANYY